MERMEAIRVRKKILVILVLPVVAVLQAIGWTMYWVCSKQQEQNEKPKQFHVVLEELRDDV